MLMELDIMMRSSGIARGNSKSGHLIKSNAIIFRAVDSPLKRKSALQFQHAHIK